MPVTAMPTLQQTLVLLFLVLGLLLVLGGTGLLVVEKTRVKEGRAAAGVGGLFIVLGLLGLFTPLGRLIADQTSPASAPEGVLVRLDFEQDNVGDWSAESPSQLDQVAKPARSSDYAFTGKYSMKVDTHMEKDTDVLVHLWYRGPRPQAAIVAHVYLPAAASPPDRYVRASLFTHAVSKMESGDYHETGAFRLIAGWNTVVWDTRDLSWNGSDPTETAFHFGAGGGSYDGAIYIDDIELYEK